MASRLSQDEWCRLFEKAEHDIAPSTAKPQDTKASQLLDVRAIAGSIDHTLLKLDATDSQINDLCTEAKQYAFKSVCVRLRWVERAVRNLRGTPVLVACVIGFHEGIHPSEEKQLEAESAVKAGAKELDMVINHDLLKQKRYPEVYADIAAVRSAAPPPIVLKVILETAVLSRADIIAGCKIAEAAKADFVKTSTGFNGPGATAANVQLMRSVVGDQMNVKASGGIRTMKDLKAMVEAGADRIGASSGVSIMNEAETQHDATRNEAEREDTEPPSQASY